MAISHGTQKDQQSQHSQSKLWLWVDSCVSFPSPPLPPPALPHYALLPLHTDLTLPSSCSSPPSSSPSSHSTLPLSCGSCPSHQPSPLLFYHIMPSSLSTPPLETRPPFPAFKVNYSARLGWHHPKDSRICGCG